MTSVRVLGCADFLQSFNHHGEHGRSDQLVHVNMFSRSPQKQNTILISDLDNEQKLQNLKDHCYE